MCFGYNIPISTNGNMLCIIIILVYKSYIYLCERLFESEQRLFALYSKTPKNIINNNASNNKIIISSFFLLLYIFDEMASSYQEGAIIII